MSEGSSKKKYLWGAIFAVALVAPRVARFCHPQAHFEDAPYLDIIASLSRGLRPHVDFIHTHFVFPEILLGLLYRITLPSYRVTEAVSALVITATAYVIYLLGRDLRSPRLGAIAAIIYATHPAFFLYHVFEKETYEAFLGGALALVIWRKSEGWRWVVAASTICVLGFLTKLDFAFLAAAICLYLLVVERRVGASFAMGGLFLGLVIAISVVFYGIYGKEFFDQVYLFHFFKGHESSWLAKLFKWFQAAGYLLFLSLAAIPYFKSVERNKLYYIGFWLGGPMVFFMLLTDTFWAHNVITLAPQLCLVAALFIDEFITWFERVVLKRGDSHLIRGDGILAPALMVAVLVMSTWYFVFWAKLHFGFGYIDRARIEQVATLVKDNSRPNEIIIAPPIIAAESDRTDIVHNREVYPVYIWAMGRVKEVGFKEARREAMEFTFRQLYEHTSHLWLDEAWRDIETRRAAVVVGDPGSQYQSFNPDASRMEGAGYTSIYNDREYVVWVRK